MNLRRILLLAFVAWGGFAVLILASYLARR